MYASRAPASADSSPEPKKRKLRRKKGDPFSDRWVASDANCRKREALKELLVGEGFSEETASTITKPSAVWQFRQDFSREDAAETVRYLKATMGQGPTAAILCSEGGLSILRAKPAGVRAWVRYMMCVGVGGVHPGGARRPNMPRYGETIAA